MTPSSAAPTYAEALLTRFKKNDLFHGMNVRSDSMNHVGLTVFRYFLPYGFLCQKSKSSTAHTDQKSAAFSIYHNSR